MESLFRQCFIFTVFVITCGIQEQCKVSLYYNPLTSKICPKKDNFLKCLPDFFDGLFTYSIQDDIGENATIMRTRKLYENSQCVAQSITYRKPLVHSFGTLFEDIVKLKTLNQGSDEESKTKKKIYENGIQIKANISKDQNIFSTLKKIINSFLQKLEPAKQTDPNDEFSQYLSENLLACLVYHFKATFDFSLPKTIKEQDKLLQRNFNWNSGFIAKTAEISKTMFIYIARMFDVLFNPPSSNSMEQQRKKHIKDFYQTLDDIKDELGDKIGLNATVTVNRILYEFIERIEEPLPNDPDVKIRRAIFDGVPVFILEPTKSSSELLPGLVHFHGGGWVYRKPEKYLPQTAHLSKNLNAVVISVDYRRSPEYKYPYPVNDCLTATKYFMNNARNFNVDGERIGIIGDSAGGNMAAAVSLMLRDSKLKKPKTQVLIYPCIQMFDLNLPSHQQVHIMFGVDHNAILIGFYLIYQNLNLSFVDAVSKNKHICDDMKNSVQSSYIDFKVIPREFLKNYVRDETECDPILAEAVKKTMLDPYIFPFMAKDLQNLPPTLLIHGEFDNLRDEGLMFGSRLRKAGIPLEEHLIKGGYHDMFNLLNFKVSNVGKKAMAILVSYLKKNL